MANPIHRSRGKRGAPDVTRNLGTNKTTVTHRDPRKKGSLGSRVTKSYTSDGKTYRTESWNYGGGVTKRSKRLVSSFASTMSSGLASSTKTRTRRGSNSKGDPAVALGAAILLIVGSVIFWIGYFILTYWYITLPILAYLSYPKIKEWKEQRRVNSLPAIGTDNKTGYTYSGKLENSYREWKSKNNLD